MILGETLDLFSDPRIYYSISGKRYDPAQDESYKTIVGVETRAAAIEKKVLEIAEELTDIDRGHLDKNLHQEASKSLQKRVKSSNEELQKLLEVLDGIHLAEDQLGETESFCIDF